MLHALTYDSSYRSSHSVSLGQLAHAIGATIVGDASTPVIGLRQDSRGIQPGEIFVARKGQTSNGVAFVAQAVARGAAAIMIEANHALTGSLVPMLLVEDIRVALARAAEVVYGEPTRDVSVVAITGTNGKTTTSHLVRSVLGAAGVRPGIMGTFGVRFGGSEFDSGFNTPEADEITRIAAWMRDGGASHLIMELTSHGIAEKRADGLRLAVAAFTNLTHDHLDLHGTMAAYGEAKARLFVELNPATCAVMVDDDFGKTLADRIHRPVLRVSRHTNAMADVRPASPVVLDGRGIRCAVSTPSGLFDLVSPLVGEHNLANVLLALGVAVCLGLDAGKTVAALATAEPVPGRLERCDGPADDMVVAVDYAHSPDALEKALHAMRLWGNGPVTCVFGCGGDRDRLKRAPMGEVAGRLANRIIVTNDNPRTESPEAIAEAILEGLRNTKANVVVELDRARAIARAVVEAHTGALVLIAGRGHETVQVIGRQALHFDDCEHVRAALSARRGEAR